MNDVRPSKQCSAHVDPTLDAGSIFPFVNIVAAPFDIFVALLMLGDVYYYLIRHRRPPPTDGNRKKLLRKSSRFYLFSFCWALFLFFCLLLPLGLKVDSSRLAYHFGSGRFEISDETGLIRRKSIGRRRRVCGRIIFFWEYGIHTTIFYHLIQQKYI